MPNEAETHGVVVLEPQGAHGHRKCTFASALMTRPEAERMARTLTGVGEGAPEIVDAVTLLTWKRLMVSK